ncbi:MAG: hypothetical protein IT537_14975 [Hyphomicrobiales bacterium]|nr:hypothetical protein [Hyphomicrobiales bacterium]
MKTAFTHIGTNLGAPIGHHDLSISNAISQAVAATGKASSEQTAAESHFPGIGISHLGADQFRSIGSGADGDEADAAGQHTTPTDVSSQSGGQQANSDASGTDTGDAPGGAGGGVAAGSDAAQSDTAFDSGNPSAGASGSTDGAGGSAGAGSASAQDAAASGSGGDFDDGSSGTCNVDGSDTVTDSEGNTTTTSVDKDENGATITKTNEDTGETTVDTIGYSDTGGIGDESVVTTDADGNVTDSIYVDEDGNGQSVEPQDPDDSDGSDDDGSDEEGSDDDGQSTEPEENGGTSGGEGDGSSEDDGQSTPPGEEDGSGAEMSTEEGAGQPPAGGDDGIPDEDHQFTLPPGFDLFHDGLKQMPKLGQDNGDTINVAGDDITGLVTASDGPFVDHGVQNGVSDPVGPAGELGNAGQSGGPGSVGPGMGNGDVINVLDAPVQGTGPEERQGHDVPLEPSAAGNSSGSNSSQEGSDGKSDSYSAPSIGTIAETPAQTAAHALPDAIGTHDKGPQGAADHLPPSIEKIDAHDFGLGAHLDGGSGFADLIKAAQTPAQSGLAIHAVAPEIPQHLALGAELGSLGAHSGDDASAHAAPMAALHDAHIEHHVEQHAAPVLDHIVAHH